MNRHLRRWLAAAAVLAGAIDLGVPAWADDPLLDLGIRQYRDGDLKAAVFSLDSAARRLAAAYSDRREQSRALVFLGAAHFGLGQADRGRDGLRQALSLTPELDVSKDGLPEDVVKELDALRRKKSAWSRLPVLVGATLAGAGAGVGADVLARETRSARDNRLPEGRATVFPEGVAIAGVTALTFSASVVDADGDPLTYVWRFGDSLLSEGATAKHTYLNPGTFNVQLAVSDGRGTPVVVEKTVVVRSMSGRWRQNPYEPYTFVQTGIYVETDEVSESPVGAGKRYWKGTLEHPRRIVMRVYHGTRASQAIGAECVGEVDARLDVISCVSGLYLIEMRRE